MKILRLFDLQLAKLESWHPSQHVYTESLSGAVESTAVICDKGSNKANESHQGKHVGTADLVFTSKSSLQ